MAHIHELIDFTVECYIVHENKVILIHHKQLNKWLPVGGHIELNEDPEEALIREVKEETGLDIKVYGTKPSLISEGIKFLYCPLYLDIHKINDTHRHVGMVYFATSDTDKLTLEADEHNEIRWFSKSDLENPKFKIQTDVKYYSQKALEKLGK
jgi:8-oxo-dGTP pyrophosphatase MutT (NUDIX family)